MRLRDGVVSYDLDGERFTVSATGAFGGMLRSNATAAFIVEQLATETTEEAIVSAMAERYDAPRERIAADVHKVIAQLRELNVLEED